VFYCKVQTRQSLTHNNSSRLTAIFKGNLSEPVPEYYRSRFYGWWKWWL